MFSSVPRLQCALALPNGREQNERAEANVLEGSRCVSDLTKLRLVMLRALLVVVSEEKEKRKKCKYRILTWVEVFGGERMMPPLLLQLL